MRQSVVPRSQKIPRENVTHFSLSLSLSLFLSCSSPFESCVRSGTLARPANTRGETKRKKKNEKKKEELEDRDERYMSVLFFSLSSSVHGGTETGEYNTCIAEVQ